MAFPRAIFVGRMKYAADDFESFGSADPNYSDSGHTERSRNGCYSILAKHSAALPLYCLIVKLVSKLFSFSFPATLVVSRLRGKNNDFSKFAFAAALRDQ